jgi:hypothetical protein
MLERVLAEAERTIVNTLSSEEQSNYYERRRPLRNNGPAPEPG